MKRFLTIKILLVAIFMATGFMLSAQSNIAQEEPKDAESQCQLGVRYLYGYYVAQDYEKALYYFRQAAEQGHAEAQLYVGWFYFDGIVVKQDYNEAARLFRKATDLGMSMDMLVNALSLLGVNSEKLLQAQLQTLPQAQYFYLIMGAKKDFSLYSLAYSKENKYQYLKDILDKILKISEISNQFPNEPIRQNDYKEIMDVLSFLDVNEIKELASSSVCQLPGRDIRYILYEIGTYCYQSRLKEKSVSCMETILDLAMENNTYGDYFVPALNSLELLKQNSVIDKRLAYIDDDIISAMPPECRRAVKYYNGMCYYYKNSQEDALPLLEQAVEISMRNNLIDQNLVNTLEMIEFMRNVNSTLGTFHVLIDNVMAGLDGSHDNYIMAQLLLLQGKVETDDVRQQELMLRAKEKFDSSDNEKGSFYIDCCNLLAQNYLKNKDIVASYWCLNNMIVECEDAFEGYPSKAFVTFGLLRDVYLAQDDSVMADRVFYTKVLNYALKMADTHPDFSAAETKKAVKVAQGYYNMLVEGYNDDIDVNSINNRYLMGGMISPIYTDMAVECFANAIDRSQCKQLDYDLTQAFLGLLYAAISLKNDSILNKYMPMAVDYARKNNNDIMNEATLYYGCAFNYLVYYFYSKDTYANYQQQAKACLGDARNAKPSKDEALIIDLLSAVIEYSDNPRAKTEVTLENALQKVMKSNLDKEDKDNTEYYVKQWVEQIKNDQ